MTDVPLDFMSLAQHPASHSVTWAACLDHDPLYPPCLIISLGVIRGPLLNPRPLAYQFFSPSSHPHSLDPHYSLTGWRAVEITADALRSAGALSSSQVGHQRGTEASIGGAGAGAVQPPSLLAS